MSLKKNDEIDLETLIHAYICTLSEAGRQEILAEIASGGRPRGLMEEMLETQAGARAAFGYVISEQRMAAAVARLAGEEKPDVPAAPRCSSSVPGWRGLSWMWRVAAVLVIGVSLYVAVSAQLTSRGLEKELAGLRQSLAAPEVFAPTAEELADYQQIWNQVKGDANTWVLLRNGEGELGSVGPETPDASTGGAAGGEKALLVQLRVVNQANRCVYSADLLMPERKNATVKLAKAGTIGGRVASLAVGTAGERAIVNLNMDGKDATPVGVAGETGIGTGASEIGRFQVENDNLRMFARTQRIAGMKI